MLDFNMVIFYEAMRLVYPDLNNLHNCPNTSCCICATLYLNNTVHLIFPLCSIELVEGHMDAGSTGVLDKSKLQREGISVYMVQPCKHTLFFLILQGAIEWIDEWSI